LANPDEIRQIVTFEIRIAWHSLDLRSKRNNSFEVEKEGEHK